MLEAGDLDGYAVWRRNSENGQDTADPDRTASGHSRISAFAGILLQNSHCDHLAITRPPGRNDRIETVSATNHSCPKRPPSQSILRPNGPKEYFCNRINAKADLSHSLASPHCLAISQRARYRLD